jgi:hypothetical protein
LTANTFEITLHSLSNRLDVVYYKIRNEVQQELGACGEPLHTLCTPVRTKTPPRVAYIEEGTPCIKLRNVTGKILNISNCDHIAESQSDEYVKAKKFDIIVTATGEGTAGRADIFLEDDTYIVTGENILLRSNTSKIDPFYLLGILRTDTIAKQLRHYVRERLDKHIFIGRT